MAEMKYLNDVVTVLTANVIETDLVMNVASSSGFPILGTGDWFWATLRRVADGEQERIRVTAITGTTWTIERDAVALAFNTGDGVFLRMNAEFISDLLRPNMQVLGQFSVAAGTADAMTASLSIPARSLVDGMEVSVRAIARNTITAPTLDLDGLGALTITRLGGKALVVGDISGAGYEMKLRYRESPVGWELLNPSLLPSATGRIGVLGASEIVFPWFDSWSSLAQRAFDAEGIDVDIFHTGTGGLTYYRAMNMVDPEIGQTYVQLTNSLNLDIIIVELGLNDAMQNGDGRTQAQVIADAQAVYAALRAGSPDAVIIYSRLVPYDEDQHGTKAVTAIKKKYCVPYMHSTSTMPGESGLYTSEEAELEKIIDPVMQGRLTDWRVLDATCQGLADVVVHSNYFKPARLGLVSYDRLHGTSLGYFFILSEMWKAFKTDTALRTQIPELSKIRYLGDFTDLSITWESAVKPDAVGDGYVIDPDWVDGFEYPMWLNVRDHSKIASYPEYWSNQQRPSISISDRVVRANGEVFAVMIVNVWPDQPVSTKIWAVGSAEPSTFTEYTPAKFTSGTGDLIEAYSPSSVDKPSGDYLIKYKIGNDVFGPFPVAISGAYPSSGGVAVAVFKNVTAPNATAAGMWKNVIVDTTDFNEAPSVITLEPGSGRIDIAYGAGYTYFKVTGYATIRSNGAGHYGLSYSRNGVAQHDRGCANLAYTPSVGSFAPLSFSTEWIPIGVAGEYVSLQALGPAVSYITQTYGTFIQIELR